MDVLEYLAVLLQTSLGSLAAYLAAHMLLCLLPAFFIAGALAALIADTLQVGLLTNSYATFTLRARGSIRSRAGWTASCRLTPAWASRA